MEPITTGLTGIVIMVVLLLCGIPVAFSMALVGYAGLIVLSNLAAASNMAASIPYDIISDYNFCVLPLFLLMANICFNTGFGRSLFDFTYKWTGRVPGGLFASAITACAMFGAVCSSILATSMTIGAVALPEMKRYKYDATLGAASVAAGGVLGILIPPSSAFIVYGIMTEQSIGELFISGIGPGIVLCLLFIGFVLVRVKLNPSLAPTAPRFSVKEKIASALSCIDVILLIALSIGGLIAGWFTPTEAGGVGSVGAILLAFIRRKLTWEAFKKTCLETVLGTGMIYLMLIGALIFNSFLTLSTVPMELASMVGSLQVDRNVIMGAIVLIYLLMGMLIDAMAMLLLTVPAFFPLIVKLGYDPIWFGTVITIAMGMAAITPPVGMGVYVVSGLDRDVGMGKLFATIIPFLAIELVFIIIVTAFPDIVLWLPKVTMH
jgi:tripartite ATP-independent transporter DctM subunit